SRHVAFGGSQGADDFPARLVPHFLLQTGRIPNQIPTGPWRAPGDNTFAWVTNSFLDELAHAAGRDPVEFNLDLLGSHGVLPASRPRGGSYNVPRMRKVIEVAAEKSGWGAKLPPGEGMGLGYYFSHAGYVAEVAKVTVSKSGDLKVDRVVAAVDVGSQIVNLSGAESQIQGSIIDGLGAAWYQEVNVDQGRVVEGNLAEYPMIRLPDAPRDIQIHYVKSPYPPTGLGEPCLPSIAPAVSNAIFAATGKRIRQLPFSGTDLSWA
ncbi:MAG TPA: molybdopterin cofactor-binding domain-containing protein, partial [bacterium]|nr:molybdopterin cofactor-binding domain-containing protein [bacterium]